MRSRMDGVVYAIRAKPDVTLLTVLATGSVCSERASATLDFQEIPATEVSI